MNKNDIRIQAYVDLELNELLAQYAKSCNLTLSAAVSQILREKLFNLTQLTNKPSESTDLAYLTQIELNSILQGVSCPVYGLESILNDDLDYVTQAEFKGMVAAVIDAFSKLDGVLVRSPMSFDSKPNLNRAARRKAQRPGRLL